MKRNKGLLPRRENANECGSHQGQEGQEPTARQPWRTGENHNRLPRIEDGGETADARHDVIETVGVAIDATDADKFDLAPVFNA